MDDFMPKLRCPCGFIHNLSPIPDDGWLTIQDRAFDAISSAPVENVDALLDRLHLASGSLYECPECRRLMWSLPGDRCTTFKVYSPDETS
jgi:hypothetical protein